MTRNDGAGKLPEELFREAEVSAFGILGRPRNGPRRSPATPCLKTKLVRYMQGRPSVRYRSVELSTFVC